MECMQEPEREKIILMTEAEAIGLLEMATRFKEDLTADQQNAIAKVTELCREFYRELETVSASARINGGERPNRPHVRMN